MVDYLCDRTGRYGYPFAWNIKVYSCDSSGRVEGGERVEPLLDAAWERHLEQNDSVFWEACELALSEYLDGEYTSYPGDDQGLWSFTVEGRMGGWLILSSYDGHDFSGMGYGDLSELREYLQDIPWSELRGLYRGVVCLERDIKPTQALEHAYNLLRAEWEPRQMVDSLGMSPLAAHSSTV